MGIPVIQGAFHWNPCYTRCIPSESLLYRVHFIGSPVIQGASICHTTLPEAIYGQSFNRGRGAMDFGLNLGCDFATPSVNADILARIPNNTYTMYIYDYILPKVLALPSMIILLIM